jgi:cellulose synthase/poly-beta-1,6-N-acetylglucosamine synthase-like glycosyltransferase
VELQVILAYNTPAPMAVEAELRVLAADDPRLVLLRVANSDSKAANVDAALALATGEFCGIFDADHRPENGAFVRAWQALRSGADVVQGHCAVRDGHRSLLARTVAVEFAAMYGLVHPGRRRVFGFGVFGGSNGYWQTDVLRRVRFRTDALTEDIDASIRLIAYGGRIDFDPDIRSWELSPPDLAAFVRQRQRWAQGWLQVGLCHLHRVLRTRSVSRRVRLAAVWTFAWCPFVPWVNLVAPPLLVERCVHTRHLPVEEPLFVGLLVLTVSSGSLRAVLTWCVAPPALRAHPGWLLAGLLSQPLLGLIRNHATRRAHLAELLGEHAWPVTPRPDDLRREGEPALPESVTAGQAA